MLDIANAMARLHEIVSRGDPLSIEFANWLGVYHASPVTGASDDALWNHREVAMAALQNASGRPEHRPFIDGLTQLRSCRFFTPWNPGVFVTDPFAMFCVAIGVRRLGDSNSAVWLAELAKRAMEKEYVRWRISLLSATIMILVNEPAGEIVPELLVALSTKELLPFHEKVAQDALAASMASESPSPEEAAVRFAALRVLAQRGEFINRNWKILEANSEPQLESNPLKCLPNSKIKILFLGANPTHTQHMALNRESHEIEDRIRLSPLRDNFEFVKEVAVRVRDLQVALLRHQPQIVHLSAHGRGECDNGRSSIGRTREFLTFTETNDNNISGELLLEDDNGRAVPISGFVLAELFKIIGGVRCVILNACNSVAQAEAICQHVDVVVGMTQAIKDEAAINFAWAFYQGLGFGRPVRAAFELGRNQIDVAGLGQGRVPQLLLREPESELVLFPPNLQSGQTR